MKTRFVSVFLLSLLLALDLFSISTKGYAQSIENTFFLPLNTDYKSEKALEKPYKLPKVSESNFDKSFYYKNNIENQNKPQDKPQENSDLSSTTIKINKEKIDEIAYEFRKAAEHHDFKKVKEIIENGLKIGLKKDYIHEYSQLGLIGIAVEANDKKIIKYLLSIGVPLCPKGAKNPIFSALTRSHVKSGVLQYLINLGCKVNTVSNFEMVFDDDEKNTPILCAAYDYDYCHTINGVHMDCNHDGPFEVYDLLLKNGADIHYTNSHDFSVLDMVIISGADPNKIEYFINHGINIDANEESKLNKALFTAALCIQPECFKVLLEYGADPFYKIDGENAIFSSIHNDSENEEIMQMMFDAGVDVNETDKDGKTALYYTMPDRISSSYRLISNGANVDITLQNGSSPLIESCKRNGYYKCEELWLLCRNEFMEIVKRTKNVDFKDPEGRTALMWVMISEKEEKWFCNHIMMVKELIKAGADPNLKDNYGKSALDYANQLEKVSAEIYRKAMNQN